MQPRKFKPSMLHALIAAGAAGLAVSAQTSVAQTGQLDRDATRLQHIEAWAGDDFQQSDANADAGASWEEIWAIHADVLTDVRWTEAQVLEQFDHNNDGILQENEYVVFISHLVDEKLARFTSEYTGDEGTDGITGPANELASEAVDGAMIPERSTIPWTDVQLVDSAGIAVLNVKGQYQRLSLPTFDDLELVNLQGDVLGEVENVVVSSDGLEQGLVIEMGGFLGLGTTDVFVPLASVYLVGEQLVWETLLSSDTIEDRESYHFQEEGFTRLLED